MIAERYEFHPDMPSIAGNLRVARPKLETCAYDVPVAIPTSPANPLPLFSFVSPEGLKSLRTPIMLRVSVEDGEVYVENEALNIFGQGKTLHAAVESFSRDLAYFWSYYRNLTADQVTGEGAVLKKVYEELVA
jgi:hypothetical protein